ncbi:HET-domain-containing protein [Bimuria novae-zelandiae CBS 107.79]|uniref:HET-domain-containing protein n=1 Tax=Bimuria novae-zelandiae CBS 107.79 TaxID=1447943 RepID=A0A6A5UMW7_9PLEO|nr:HET-domain-containing protein [Bimuria novae-zelandiae CBS 107.79]
MNMAPDDNTGSESAFLMAAAWLRNCLHSHRQCGTNRGEYSPPTRLVDISNLKDSGNPKLITGERADGPYIALSHLWGRESLPRTTRSNLDDHMHAIPMHTLSNSIRDAISIVKRLSIHYLWIDALCIIQDSQEDWLAEASTWVLSIVTRY